MAEGLREVGGLGVDLPTVGTVWWVAGRVGIGWYGFDDW